ncbi:MAG: hypothetical protein IJ748_05805 [Bacteroidales bacterium]|nr:hypothetical protein [Bacteroidales bacterium]
MVSYLRKNKLLFAILAVVCYFVLMFAVHRLFQNPNYSFVTSYHVDLTAEGKNAYLTHEPFIPFKSSNLTNWDADHYFYLKNTLYEPTEDERWLSEFAFFPLFPLLWHYSFLNSVGISLLNILLFVLGMVFIFLLFKDKLSLPSLLLALTAPMLVVFAIPYAESLFFLFIAMGLYGIQKDKYYLYFIGFFFASLTKSYTLLIFLSFFCVELIKAIREKSYKAMFKSLGFKILPVVLGIVCVLVFQYIQGAPSFFHTFTCQKYWGKSLSLPQFPLTEWSSESKCVSFPFTYIYFIPSVAVIIAEFFLSFRKKANQVLTKENYLFIFSLLFIVGNIFTALLTQQGNIHSLARYIYCTPFFFYLIFYLQTREYSKVEYIFFSILVLLIVICFFEYFGYVDTRGIYLILILSILTFFRRKIPQFIYNTVLIIGILISVYWNAFLLDCFLKNAWLFA